MKLQVSLAALLGLGLLSACDAVRVPGGDRPDDAAPASPAPEPTAPDVSQPSPPDMSGTVDTGASLPGDVPPVAVTPEPEPEPAPVVTDLAQINAVVCGLQRTETETLTVAQLSRQQDDGPAQESLLQTAAVGGIAATLTSFPGIVKMEPRRIEPGDRVASGHCGATRISERWFLTAAHCVDEGYDEIRFVTGVENVLDEDNAEIVKAELSVCHAAFEASSTYPNDIALLRMPEDAVARLATIPVANYGETEKTLTSFNYPVVEMAGWGVTQFNSLPSPILLSAALDVVSTGAGQITIASRNGSGPCVGDSGGPLYVREDDEKMVVVGVLSHVIPAADGSVCEGAYRGRYTNLQSYLDWIDNVTRACDADTLLCK